MRHRPLLCGTLGFMAGLGAWAAGLHLPAGAFLLGLVGLALLCRGRPGLGLIGLVLAGIAVGGLRLGAFETIPAADVSHWADRPAPVQLTGLVDSDPERRSERIAFLLHAERLVQHGQRQNVSGEARVTVPAQASLPDYGDRVTLEGMLETPLDATNPGAFSWRAYLARRGIFCQMRVRRPESVRILGASFANPALRVAWQVRRCLLHALTASCSPVPAAVLSGILIGWRADLPPSLMDDFVRTGTVHILASAGLHVGIVAFWLLKLCERLTLPRKSSAFLIIGTLWLYAVACGGRPSVTRAVVMASVYFAATIFERDPDLPTTIAVAALLILLAQPTALLESGFQLSFLTVLTLAVGMPVWGAFWRPRVDAWFTRSQSRKVVWWALEIAGLSLLAQIGALPIVARDYNEVSVLGLLANLLVVPVLFLLIPLGFGGALVWGAWHAAGAALLMPCTLLVRWIVFIVHGCAAPVWASRALASPSPAWIALYYAAVGGVLFLLHRARGPRSAADSDAFAVSS